jgi:hypothetical protein
MTRHFRGKGTTYNVVISCDESHDKGFSVLDLDTFLQEIRPLLNKGVEIKDKFPYWTKE